ncbi:hypothetical protein NP493_810g01016 [Ridgeia piscesae]|uniref:Multidrug and toxin extrusion protein n=1 Tax=Ridgeia piscesae TaxID=27915 RepID=A0AAD9KN45_RIDPI|nr:hypothetical protein NP493_810g01016 [Ridgeia piscesae]
MLIGPISLIFCGHLGDPIQLDGAALGISMINVTSTAIALGLGTACDTFFSQTFGSRNKKLMGVYAQKAVYIFLLVLMPCFAVHLNFGSFLALVGQHPEVSRLAGRYLVIFMPGALSFFMYIILLKFIQNQNIVLPNVVIAIVANVVNAVLQYVFLFQLHWGTDGSAVAQVCAYFTLFALTFLYIVWTKAYKDTWGGWSSDSLQGWGTFARISISGMLMLCLEWWGFELGVFLTGLLGTTELGAQSVLLQIDILWYQIPLGIQIATTIRIGQLLGARDEIGAKTVAHISIALLVIIITNTGAYDGGTRSNDADVNVSFQRSSGLDIPVDANGDDLPILRRNRYGMQRSPLWNGSTGLWRSALIRLLLRYRPTSGNISHVPHVAAISR